MTAYAIAYLREVDFGEEIIDYLSRIDVTLAPVRRPVPRPRRRRSTASRASGTAT